MKSRFFVNVAGLIMTLSFCGHSFPAIACVQQETAELVDASEDSTTDSDFDSVSGWSVDNRHSSVIFAVSHAGLSYVYGRFNKVAGTVKIDAETPESSTFSFAIDPASIDTNDEDRDRQLRSATFLDVGQYDSISFSSTDVKLKVEPQAGADPKRTFMVGGNLTLHGETRRIVLPIELLAAGKGKDGLYRCGFMSKFVVKRSSHGVDAMPNEIGDSVAVTFSFQAIQKIDESAGTDDSPEATEEVPAVRPPQDGSLDVGVGIKQQRVEQLFR